jgi:Prokaryotic E2 family E
VLPSNDVNYLTERAIKHSVTTEANMTCVLFPAYQLPGGYDRTQSDLLLRMPAIAVSIFMLILLLAHIYPYLLILLFA